MKTSQLFATIAIAAASFTQTTLANPISNTNPIKNPIEATSAKVRVSVVNKSIVLNLGNVTKETITVKIVDAQGDVIYKETVAKVPNFRKTYNLANLDDGSYSLVVTKTTVKTTQPFAIDGAAIALSDAMQEDKFVPVFGFENDKLSVNYLMQTAGKVSVKIYDNEGKSVLTNNYDSMLALHKRFDTAGLTSGAYFVEVVTADETYDYSFTK